MMPDSSAWLARFAGLGGLAEVERSQGLGGRGGVSGNEDWEWRIVGGTRGGLNVRAGRGGEEGEEGRWVRRGGG